MGLVLICRFGRACRSISGVRGGTPGVDRTKVGRRSGNLPFKDSSNKVYRSSRHLCWRVADRVVNRRSVDGWEWAKSVVGKVKYGVGVGPGADNIDLGDGSRPTVVTHEKLL